VFLGLWLEERHGDELAGGGFDGFYTYFASSGFSYGSTPAHWPEMVRQGRRLGMLSSLSVGPGYDDEKIRPWNAMNTRDREGNGDRGREMSVRRLTPLCAFCRHGVL
jgi:glycoprotein endo-alpha-1,2-mannosidase